MHFLNYLLSAIVIFTSVQADGVQNTTQEYYLRTSLKPGQPKKAAFNNLYLETYHTGAGLSDAVLNPSRNGASKGFLNATKTKGDNRTYANQLFDLGNDFAWGLVMEQNVNFYASWQPVLINAGVTGRSANVNGFFIDSNGLQWTTNFKQPGTNDAFGGWLVCEWWDLVPQLFFQVGYLGTTYKIPSSCAKVNLIPEYI